MFKVGSELFSAEGPLLVRELVASGQKVFLDLKFHDIPNTVRSAVCEAAKLGVSLIDVHASGGRKMMEAALEGAQEVGFTILSMTLSLAAVFIPLMFMGGIIGQLFKEFAITIAVAILVSGLVSLTLTPMLCSRLLKPHGTETHGRWYLATERAFDASLRAYERSLGWVMEHRPIGLAFSVLVLIFTAVLWVVIPKGLFPPDDTGQLNATAEAAQGTSYPEMLRLEQIAARRLERDTNVASFTANVGGGMGSSNQAQFNLTLKPQGQRPSAG